MPSSPSRVTFATGVSANFATLATATTLLPANPSRKYLRISPTSVTPTALYVTFDGTTPSATNGVMIVVGTGGIQSLLEFGHSWVPTGEIKAIGGAGINVIWA